MIEELDSYPARLIKNLITHHHFMIDDVCTDAVGNKRCLTFFMWGLHKLRSNQKCSIEESDPPWHEVFKFLSAVLDCIGFAEEPLLHCVEPTDQLQGSECFPAGDRTEMHTIEQEDHLSNG